jgi:hypothetical protein
MKTYSCNPYAAIGLLAGLVLAALLPACAPAQQLPAAQRSPAAQQSLAVLDARTNQPVAGALVFAPGDRRVFRSDLRGTVELPPEYVGREVRVHAKNHSARSLAPAVRTNPPASAPDGWWKGNLHTHSLWSDGGEFPEVIAEWYRDHGYHFVAFTEHDILQAGEMWVDINAPDAGWPPRNASTRAALPAYRDRFGADWVIERLEGERHLVRLRGLDEYRHLFEEPGRFLLLMGEEITDRGGAHVNMINADTALLPQGGATTAERTRANVTAVAELRRRTGRPLLSIVNHPNYLWALTAEEIAAATDAHFFEVYNGHLFVNNDGDAERPGTERMWDVALTLRHAAGGAPLYGIAADDAHEYQPASDTVARPGRGWVMVRAARLETADLIAALEAGDFYGSTGVTLRSLRRDEDRISIEVEPHDGASYRIVFTGTRRAVEPGSDRVGEVLAEFSGTSGEYVFRGDERYVRATVVSSASHVDPTTGNVLGQQKAWIQPVFR